MWRIWAKALGDKTGKSNREADLIAIIRTIIVLVYLGTNIMIVMGIIHHWWFMILKRLLDNDMKKKENLDALGVDIDLDNVWKTKHTALLIVVGIVLIVSIAVSVVSWVDMVKVRNLLVLNGKL